MNIMNVALLLYIFASDDIFTVQFIDQETEDIPGFRNRGKRVANNKQ